MARLQINPYAASAESNAPLPQRRRITGASVCFCLYYTVSACTLPFANKFWFGEIPIFGLLQTPKSFLKSVLHDTLLYAVHAFGWSKGSASPDYGMTHPWAMIGMLLIPALLMASTIFVTQSGRRRTTLLAVVIACGVLDAIVTLWFDASFSLKLYNAHFF